MGKIYRAEPFVKVAPRSPVIIRAPRAAPRRMALTLLLGLAVFWIPLLIGGEIRMALLIAAIPLLFLLSTFRGANTLRLEPKKERLTIRRHYLLWSILVGQATFGDIEEVSVDRRFERGWEESPLVPLTVLLATVGIHSTFGGKEVSVPVWDLVLRLRTTEVLVVISCQEQESIEAAKTKLMEKLKLTPMPTGGADPATS